MTDASLSGAAPRRMDFNSDAARARVKARYAAEARFRAYGVAALVVTTVFLVVLLADTFVKGIPAFWQHSLDVEVTVTAADVDPSGGRDPAVLRGGDYTTIARKSLTDRFPEVTKRQDRKLLFGLLSSGAADRMREQVVADPALVGTSVATRILFSDDVDLYFKGHATAIRERAGRGTLSPVQDGDAVTISSTANDFADELVAIKKQVKARADALKEEADRLGAIVLDMSAQERDVTVALEAARRAGDAAPVARLETALATVAGDIAALKGKAAEARETSQILFKRFDDPKAAEPLDGAMPSLLVRFGNGLLKIEKLGDTRVEGRLLLPPAAWGDVGPKDWALVTYTTPEGNRRVSDQEVAWLERLKASGVVGRHFNTTFFTAGDSREAELAGIRGALVGTALTLLVTLLICLPLGVAAAIWLEEFAPKNRLTEIIEVNINNLAAVPSIVFGLLGLAVFLNFFDLPRSAPVVGGLVLALLVMPTIIIASRAALRAVPPSITEAALGVGASKQQAIFHHVLPLAMPGIMTGTIIGMAHALGETAPLLMIGMVAFIVDVPTSIADAATVLPVQIYLWSDLPEVAFQSKTAAAIIVLLGFLFVMNGAAIWLRKRFERRW